jgi:hypothetical protein
MGIHHKDGYSASVEGFLVVGVERFRLAKTNGQTITLAESCELSPGTECELLVIVDGNASARCVRLPEGVTMGQSVIKYEVRKDTSVPF